MERTARAVKGRGALESSLASRERPEARPAGRKIEASVPSVRRLMTG